MKNGSGSIITFLYRLFHAVVFSSAVILYFSDLYGTAGVTWKHFTVLFLSVALFLCVSKLQKRQRLYAIVLIALFIAFVSGVMGKEKAGAWILAESSYLWTLVFAISICVLQLWSEKYFYIKILFSVILCGMLLYSLFARRHVPQTGVLLLLLYGVMTLTEYIWLRNRNKERENSHAYVVWLAPFFILYFVVLCLMPAPKTPYSWQWLKNIYLRVEEKITIYAENLVNRNNEDLDGAISGFSESAALLSNLAADDKNIMVIETLPGKKQPLYLAGKIYDDFDGLEWKCTEEGSTGERLLDTLETLCALEAYAESESDHLTYYNGIGAKTGYRYFHTDYLLAPSKTWKIEGNMQYQQSGANLTFDKKAGYGTEYTFRYCRMNMGRETTLDFLQSGSAGNPDLWESMVNTYAEEDITYADFLAYRENMRKRYLPETKVSPETEDWLADVTKDAEDEVAGLFCIEEALADMEYNVNPGGLPGEVTDERSFLHYFLREKQEGFCTYYATAFVLLARAEGFPARYVQGFCVPMGNAKETEVYSGMAHAWPEVYFEGKGWIPFEPTPGYGVRRYPAEPVKADKEENAAEGKEFVEREYVFDNAETLEDEEDEERKEREERLRELRRTVTFITICGSLILAVGMLIFIIDRLSERYREKRRTTGEKYMRAVLRNMQILSMLGWERERSETYHELAERIEKEEDGETIPTAFIAIYENILYGTREIGERELEECLEQGDELLQILRKRKGRRYVFYWLRLSVTFSMSK